MDRRAINQVRSILKLSDYKDVFLMIQVYVTWSVNKVSVSAEVLENLGKHTST